MMQKRMILVILSAGLAIACSDSGSSGTGDGDTGTGITGTGDTGSLADSATGTGAGNTSDTGSTGDSNGDTASSSATDTSDVPSDTGINPTDSNSGTTADTSDTSISQDTAACVPVTCGGKQYICADCIDNDSDNLVDAADPDCLGPCDNNESGFNIDIDGSAPGNCDMDCYFDDNNGRGDDECVWDFRCDPDEQHYKDGKENVVCAYDPNAVHAGCEALLQEQTATCRNVCAHFTPNGCDCWGCCEIKGIYRFIGSPGCDLQHLDACDPCTPVPSCENPCSECELCIGETTLPDYCLTAIDTDSTDNPDDSDTHSEPVDTATTDNPDDTSVGDTDSTDDTEDTPVYLRCSDGRQPCGQIGDQPCADQHYCLTGCCTLVIVE